jgi:hypothetical protein
MWFPLNVVTGHSLVAHEQRQAENAMATSPTGRKSEKAAICLRIRRKASGDSKNMSYLARLRVEIYESPLKFIELFFFGIGDACL